MDARNNPFGDKFFAKKPPKVKLEDLMRSQRDSQGEAIQALPQMEDASPEYRSGVDINSLSPVDLVQHLSDCLDLLVPNLKKVGARGAARKIEQARDLVNEVVRANE